MKTVQRFVGINELPSPKTEAGIHADEKDRTMFKTITIPLLLALGAMPQIASAQDFRPEVKVSYRDLDLSRSADIRRFDRRLARAIVSVCAESSASTVYIEEKIAIEHCIKATQAGLAEERAGVLANAGGAERVALSDR